MKKIINSSCIIAVTVCSVLMSCQSGEPKQEASTTDSTKVEDSISSNDTKEKEFKFLSAIATLPSPAFQVLELKKSIDKSNISFCNSLENQNKYTSDFKKSANYGIYLSDLAYLASFKQSKDVLAYLGATKKLAENLGVKGKFEEIINKGHFEEQLNSPDSLESMIEAIYSETDKFLVSDKHLDMACELFIGSWVENSYLTLAHLKGAKLNEKNTTLISKVYDQKIHLPKIISLLEEFIEHKDLSVIAKSVNDLSQEFSKITDIKQVDEKFILVIHDKFLAIRKLIVE